MQTTTTQPQGLYFNSFVQQTKYTDSLLEFVTTVDAVYDDDVLYGQHDNPLQKQVVAKLVQALSHFTLISGVHLNNIDNQSFASQRYPNTTEFMFGQIIPIQQKLLNLYTHYHKTYISSQSSGVQSSSQEDVNAMLTMANYQIVLYSQCEFNLMKNKGIIPKTEQTKTLTKNLMKFKMDYINNAAKLLSEVIKMVNKGLDVTQSVDVDDRVFDLTKSYTDLTVTERKTRDQIDVIYAQPVNVEVKGKEIQSFDYKLELDKQIARVYAIRAVFLRELYGGSGAFGGSSSPFFAMIKQNLDLALSHSRREDALVLFEIAKFQSATKEYKDAFMTFYRSALQSLEGDLLRVRALYLSAINYQKWIQSDKDDAAILRDLVDEWQSEKVSQAKNVLEFLTKTAAASQEHIESILPENIAQHFSTKNRIVQLTTLAGEVQNLQVK